MLTIPDHKGNANQNLRFHLIPVRIVIIKNITNNKFWRGCKDKEPSYTAGGNVSWYNHFGKQYGSFFKKLNIDLPYYPAISLLGIYPKEGDSGYSNVYCSTIHNSQVMEMPRCPTTDKWIKKMWYLYTMEFYSATKKNEILSFTSKWMEL
jgi:hypothetical protein